MTRTRAAALLAVCCALPAAGCGGSDEPSATPRPMSSAALAAGLRVTLSAAAEGRVVTFTAKVDDDDGAAPGYVIDYGDGKTDSVPAPRASCASGSRTALTPVHTTVESRHTYAKAGAYAASITVTSGGGCPLPAVETVQALSLVTVG